MEVRHLSDAADVIYFIEAYKLLLTLRGNSGL